MSRILQGLAFWPRANTYEARVLEEALAGPTLFDPGVALHGAVVEAGFAASDPPLLDRFHEASVPFIIDPQALRFHSPSFLEVGALRPARADCRLSPDAWARSG